MKKVVGSLLVVCLVLALAGTAFAASGVDAARLSFERAKCSIFPVPPPPPPPPRK